MKSIFKAPYRAAVVILISSSTGMVFAQNIKLNTTAGEIILELNSKAAPKSVENFVTYVKAGHYDGTVFHRVIDDFMIQGGGMTIDMSEKITLAPIPLESKNGLKNERGTVAMARTMNPNSATSQFFINLENNSFLDQTNAPDGNGYAVFGKVVKGMNVVDKIRKTPTGNVGAHQNVPKTPIVITKASLEK